MTVVRKVVSPASKGVPPDGVSYQSTVEVGGTVACRVTIPGPHRESPCPTGFEGVLKNTALLVAVLELPYHQVLIILSWQSGSFNPHGWHPG